MALSEQEEFELLSLEREKARAKVTQPKTRMELALEAMKPDIFKTGEAAYELGGKVTDATGSPALGYITNVAAQAVPVVASGFGGTSAAPMFESAARGTMQRVLKPTLENLGKGNAARAIDTMLEGGYNATPGGLAAMKSQIANLNDEIYQAIVNSPATVDKYAVASRLNDVIKKFEKQVNPSADVAAIQKAWTEFLQHPLLNGRDIPVKLAQEMKQATYAAQGSKAYGEMKGAQVEAEKALARGLKEEISQAVPSVAPLNAAESSLLNARDVLERRVLMQGNNQKVGLGALAGSVPGFLAWMAERSPLLASLYARALFQGSEAIPGTVGALGAAGVQAQGASGGIRPDSPLR